MDDLILKIRADAKGVRPEIKGIADETDKLELSSRKASTAMRGFVQDLSQARSASDVASAALAAFSKILGTTLAGTAVVMAGKVVIDAFQKVSENVNKAKDSLSAAREEIAKMGAVTGLAEGAAQANLLYKAADEAGKAIKEIEKSKLQNVIAEIRGAKDELAKMAEEAKKAADAVKLEGIQREAAQKQIEKNLTEEEKIARKTAEQYQKMIDAARELGNMPLLESLTLEQQKATAEAVAKFRSEQDKKLFDERTRQAQELAEEAYKQIDAEFKQQYKANEDLSKQQQKIFDEEEKKKEQARQLQKKAEQESLDLLLNKLDLEQKVVEARERVVEAEGKIAQIVAGYGGSMRGPGERRTSFEIGVNTAEERAFRQEQIELSQMERERIKMQLRFERGLNPTDFISNFDVQQEIARRAREAAMQRAGEPFRAAEEARKGLGATEETLSKVRENLEKVLSELKTYAHTT